MKPILEKINLDATQSFYVNSSEEPAFFFPLHYHPELEFIYIMKSHGTRIVGNSVNNFEEGDLVLVGSNIPHVWKNDKEFYNSESKTGAQSMVIQFDPDFMGDRFFQLPEMSRIRKMFSLARRGISFTGKSRDMLIERMHKIYSLHGQERIVEFINFLHAASVAKDTEVLSTLEYTISGGNEDCEKINKIYEYLFKNYLHEVDFNKIADIVNMSLPSLCRYFKKHTFKTITDILNEIRVRHACKLLSSNKANAKEACYMAGFNNYSHFNKQFRKVTGITPLHYQKKYNA